MIRLWIKDNTNGHIHEYETNQHDSLYLKDGAIHYENMQCCASTEYPEEGYSFCLSDGTIPDYDGYDGYLDIGGEHIASEENKPLTNADRIRAMSDEELRDFIDRVELGDIDYGVTFCSMCGGNKNNNTFGFDCDGCRLHWLQQPVEEDSNGK